jgi:cell division protein FtsI/penicillin-binding protein 2
MTRFRFLFYLLLCGFFLIAQRLFTIQVLNSSKTIPLERFVSLSKKDSLRGEIFDRNFKPMVLNEKTYTI